jgi:hypothetical protein
MTPLSIQAELSHDAIRYMRQYDNVIDVGEKIVSNKLQPIARGVQIFASGKDWDGRPLRDTWERLYRGGLAVAPLPIPLKGVTGGQMERQFFSSAGIKVEPKSELSPEASAYLRGRAQDYEFARYIAGKVAGGMRAGKDRDDIIYGELSGLPDDAQERIRLMVLRAMGSRTRSHIRAENVVGGE